MTGSTDSEHESDRGLTLVELLVSVAVTSILAIVVGAVFTGALRSLDTVNVKNELNSTAQIAMETVALKLRAANVLQGPSGRTGTILMAGGANSIMFRADLPEPQAATWAPAQINAWNPTYGTSLKDGLLWPYRVKYSVSSTGCSGLPGLVEELTPYRFSATGSTSFGSPATRCLLKTASTEGISFRYFTGAAAGLSGCVLPDSAVPARWLSPIVVPAPIDELATAVLASVQSVEVTVKASDSAGRQVPLVNQICLVNN